MHNASVYLASGTHTYLVTQFEAGGYKYLVNDDGSVTNQSTGRVTPASSYSTQGKLA